MLKLSTLHLQSAPLARLGNLALALYLGLAISYLISNLIGRHVATDQVTVPTGTSAVVAVNDSAKLQDFIAITDRNIFDASPPAAVTLEEEQLSAAPSPTQTAPKVNLQLLGTVVAGQDSLALISAGGQGETYHLGDQLPGKAILQQVSRLEVVVELQDGRVQHLQLLSEEAKIPQPKPARNTPQKKPKSGYGSGQNSVRAVGENRFEIDKEAVAGARQDMGGLIKQMRVEPYTQQGKTAGFLIKWIQPGSLLGQLGLKRGDIIAEVNRVPLDSPEKALMIFQQLREARALSIGIIRRGQNQQLQYDIK